jgi:hypothetical protein
MRLKSLYIARFLLDLVGILLALFAAFALLVVPRGFHAERPHMKWVEGVILLVAIGFLLPHLLAKLLSSLFLLGAGVWLFHIDAYWRSNLGIYPLFLAPLALTLWLRAGYNDLKIQRLPNGN